MNENDEMIPANYTPCRNCITVLCGIPLTKDFIAQLISALIEADSDETLRFRRLYGDAHWRDVLSWFQRALKSEP